MQSLWWGDYVHKGSCNNCVKTGQSLGFKRLLTLTDSLPLYFTRILGSCMTSRLVPVIVRGVWPLRSRRHWVNEVWQGELGQCPESVFLENTDAYKSQQDVFYRLYRNSVTERINIPSPWLWLEQSHKLIGFSGLICPPSGQSPLPCNISQGWQDEKIKIQG